MNLNAIIVDIFLVVMEMEMEFMKKMSLTRGVQDRYRLL
jgi:hypothetical protein